MLPPNCAVLIIISFYYFSNNLLAIYLRTNDDTLLCRDPTFENNCCNNSRDRGSNYD